LNTFTVQNKFVEPVFNKVRAELEQIVNDIQCELENDREMKEAMREMKRSENMIKYKDEIKSRPKKEWFQGSERRKEAVKEGKEELKNIKSKFEGTYQNKRENKQRSKSKAKKSNTPAKKQQQ